MENNVSTRIQDREQRVMPSSSFPRYQTGCWKDRDSVALRLNAPLLSFRLAILPLPRVENIPVSQVCQGPLLPLFLGWTSIFYFASPGFPLYPTRGLTHGFNNLYTVKTQMVRLLMLLPLLSTAIEEGSRAKVLLFASMPTSASFQESHQLAQGGWWRGHVYKFRRPENILLCILPQGNSFSVGCTACPLLYKTKAEGYK